MKNIKSLVTVALAVVIIGSCKKEDPTPTTTPTPTPSTASKICRVKTDKVSMSSPSDTATFATISSSSYEYTADGMLSKQTYNDTDGTMISYTLFDYSTNGIVDVKGFSATNIQKSHTILKLGSNGYASCEINGDNPQDTLTIYEYNADGYLIKKTDKSTGAVVTNTITNGNITQTTTTLSGTTMILTFEYTDKPDKNSADKYFFGKRNTNLPSKMTMSGTAFGGKTTIMIIIYVIDSNGYPSEMIYAGSSTSSIRMKTELTYNCQ